MFPTFACARSRYRVSQIEIGKAMSLWLAVIRYWHVVESLCSTRLGVFSRQSNQRCEFGFNTALEMASKFPLNVTCNRARYQYLIATNGIAERPISKQLLACRATKDFIKFASQRGAVITINSNHARVTHNGTYTIVQSPGRKQDLHIGARMRTIEAFKAMGIAWDD